MKKIAEHRRTTYTNWLRLADFEHPKKPIFVRADMVAVIRPRYSIEYNKVKGDEVEEEVETGAIIHLTNEETIETSHTVEEIEKILFVK